MPNDSTEKDNLDSTNIDNEKVKEIFEIIKEDLKKYLLKRFKKRSLFLARETIKY